MSKPSIRPDDDHYPTPREVTRALLNVERFTPCIWEPFAGSGEMADVLKEGGYSLLATTIGESREGGPNASIRGNTDFLKTDTSYPAGFGPPMDIVTNPPYKIAEEAIRHALKHNLVKCAMLLNIKFLGSRVRKNGLFAEYPPARVWVFCDRPTMYPKGYEGKRGTTTETFAWYVWEAPFHKRPPMLGWLDSREFLSVREVK